MPFEVVSLRILNLTDAGLLLADLFSICVNFNYFSCGFVRRSGNTLAHKLAHLAMAHSFFVQGVDLSVGLAYEYKDIFPSKKKKIMDV